MHPLAELKQLVRSGGLRRPKATLLVVGLLGVSFAALAGGLVSAQLQYEPATVQLSGVVVLEEHYGPPNFGETPNIDIKERVFMLKLDNPVSVKADPSDAVNMDSFNRVDKMQLSTRAPREMSDHIGKHVVIEGSLFEKQSGEHYTNVLLTVRKVTELQPE